jgi:hypothetical protein
MVGVSLPQSFAQSEARKEVKVTGGVKAEANMSNFIFSGMSGAKSKMNVGATVGGFLSLDISEHFAIRGELLYHYKSSDFIRDNTKSEYQYWGMEVPLYAIFQQRNNRGGQYYIGFGSYTEFGLSAKIRRDGETIVLYEKDGDVTTGIAAMYDSNSGFGLIVGYEFACRMQVNAGYKISITNVLDDDSHSDVLLPVAISLGVGFRFGK